MRGRSRSRSQSGRRPRLAGVAGAAVCVLLTSATGCRDEVSAPGPVLVVGDSIFALAQEELTWVLRSDGWDVTVEAHPGAGIRGGGFGDVDWPSRLRDLVAVVDPAVVIVELGTNGCGDCDSVPEAIRDDMEQLRDVELVLWLDVATHGPRAAQGREVNAALEDAAGSWQNLELLPYDEWFAERPDLLPPDDVHVTEAGEQSLARRVGQALRDRSDSSDGSRGRALGALAFVIVAGVLLAGRNRS